MPCHFLLHRFLNTVLTACILHHSELQSPIIRENPHSETLTLYPNVFIMSTIHFNKKAYVNKDIFHYLPENIGKVFCDCIFHLLNLRQFGDDCC